MIFAYELSRFAWYRRMRGGHWEYVYVEGPVHAHFWFRQEHGRRGPSFEYLQRCEDYAA